jgi:hypothetical protein
MKLEFSLRSFEIHSNVKFHDNRSNGSRVVACGQTDRYVAILQTRLQFELRKGVRLLERDTVHLRYVLTYESNVLVPSPLIQ